MWKIINGTLNTFKNKSKKSVSKLKDASRGFIYKSSDIANSFNEFFVNIGKSMANTLPEVENNIQSPRVTSSFVLFEILEEEISMLIRNLNEHKSCREDDIPVKFLKFCCPVIASVLADIFNRCIVLGVYSSLLKTAKVIPLFKKGNGMKDLITDQLVCYCILTKYLKKLFTNGCIIFFVSLTFLIKISMGFAKNTVLHQLFTTSLKIS